MKRILPIILSASLFGTFAQTQCNICDLVKENPLRALAATVAGATILRFYMKRASSDPSRFETAKLTEAVKNGSFSEMISQLWYFIDDVIIGRQGKGSTIKVQSDGKTLAVGKSHPEIGLGGKINANLKALTTALAFMITVKKFLDKSDEGMNAWMGVFKEKKEDKK